MDLLKCEKYMSYVITEIDRRINDKTFDDNSLLQLTLELDKLKENVENSDLPQNIKSSIKTIESKYSVKKMERKSLLTFAYILTFGSYYYIYQMRENSKRKKYLMDLRHDSNAILYQIRTN